MNAPLDNFDHCKLYVAGKSVLGKRVHIYEKDFFFIPWNQDAHWTLFIVVRPGLQASRAQQQQLGCESVAFEASDANTAETDERFTGILHLDSLTDSKTRQITSATLRLQATTLLKAYLNEGYWKEIVKGGTGPTFDCFADMPVFHVDVPQQPNCNDCGLYMLMNIRKFSAECLLLEPQLVSSQTGLADCCR